MSIRCPDYFCLQVLNVISHNHLLADLITLLGTLDFVLGSVDRLDL
ncbi:MAG: NADH-quinone oxidoreductase subunit D, partial [Colwellia sp.]|nr:NADH-quinone oxidoreductase subunit D [Colwellia sp.]